jgi:hypothetical protein
MRMTPDAALEAIKNALCPPIRKENDGLLIDGNAYHNLDGARIDLVRLGADAACIRTIERVQKQLAEVSRILEQAGCK